MVQSAVESLTHAGIEDVAIALDVRGGRSLGDPLDAIEGLAQRYAARLLFLDAADGVLVRRFSATRRRHPQHKARSLREAIAADRKRLEPLRERADVVVDTGTLTHGQLKERIAQAFASQQGVRLRVTLVAFGFKNGLPPDLDLLFDVRFLRNPNYDPALAPLTGNDAGVAAFIRDDPALEPFLDKVGDLLAFLLPRYVTEGKTQVTVGVGCTGGRHRSVYVASRLLERIVSNDRFDAYVEARDLENA